MRNILNVCACLVMALGMPSPGESAQAVNRGDIVTVAGGFLGDNGPALMAGLNAPNGMAADSAGNIYTADTNNNRIRKYDPRTGVITTVAGNVAGFSGDSGPATAANLRTPYGIAVDSTGNLYVADTGNQRVRKVDATTGNITTIAGTGVVGYAGDAGLATSARLNLPRAVALDTAGNVYIADSGNNRIRKIDVATGLISTVAGNGTALWAGDGGPATAASLRSPNGIALDSDNNLYIADTTNKRLRKVNAGTGIITTLAGSATAGSGGDGGPATAATLNAPTGIVVDGSKNIYIADFTTQVVRRIDGATGIITTVAGSRVAGYSGDNSAATAAKLQSPSGIVLDGAGNLYIADSSNKAIRKVSSGIITTVAGGVTFAGDNGPATAAMLNSPYKLAFDSAGNYYIADTYNHRVRKVAVGTGVITTVAGNGMAGFSGDNGPATSASLNAPGGLAFDAAGNLYIADSVNCRIRKVAVGTGIITTIAGDGTSGTIGDNGPATSAGVYYPNGLAFDRDGNLYIADTNHNSIRKINAANGIISTVVSGLYNPVGITFDNDWNLYIADSKNNRVLKVPAGTNTIITVAGDGTAAHSGDNGPAGSSRVNWPYDIASDGVGNIFVAEFGTSHIRKIAAGTGIITSVAGNGLSGYIGDNVPATSTSINGPIGVSVDGAGNLYIADTGNNRIRKVYQSLGVGAPAVPSVAAGSVASTTQTSATLNGTANDNSANTTVAFEYGVSTSYGGSVSGGKYVAGSGLVAVSANITGLTCGTTYHFRVVGVNSAGTSYSNDASFTTVACPANGSCGSSNGATFAALPTNNLCTLGDVTALTGGGPWNWTCRGTNGGTDMDCSAQSSAGGANSTVLLPKTGQTSCWDTTGAAVSCLGTGQDADVRAGAAWPNPRFADNGDQTITDGLTGLIWSRDADHAATSKTWQEALDYVKTLNAQNYLNHNDWRLPNQNELASLLTAQSSSSNWLTSKGFSNVYSGYSYWWTSSTDATNPSNAWVVGPSENNGYGDDKTVGYYVWPVRGSSSGAITLSKTGQTLCHDSVGAVIACAATGQDGELQLGAAWPGQRFTDNNDQTQRDNLTGLVWSKSAHAPGPAMCTPNTIKSWQGALDYVSCLNSNSYLGYRNWRLPNRTELVSLVRQGVARNATWLVEQGFNNVYAYGYWTSTTDGVSRNSAYDVWLTDGSYGSNPKSANMYVWPVRDNQPGGLVDLRISKSGSGSGAIAATSGAINWSGNSGMLSAVAGTSVTLTPTPEPGSTFAGWTGDCGGSGTCTVSLDATRTVTATFDLVQPPIAGVCGGANNSTGISAPAAGLCSAGTPSAVSGNGPWSWSCNGLYGGNPASCSAAIQTYTLTVAVSGSGEAGGTVTSNPQGINPAGISCASGTCSTEFIYNQNVSLLQVPNAISVFGGWGGDCGGKGACGFGMTGQKTVTATFVLAPKAMVDGNGYATLAAAYGAALSGRTIQLLDSELPDNGLDINETLAGGKSIALKGGYRADYSGQSGLPTYLKGPLRISSGRVSTERLKVR